MAEKESASPKSGSLDDLREELLQRDPEFRKLWEASAPKRAIAIALVRMRKQAKMTQSELAERANWDKGFVSRLEGANGPMPDTATLARYAKACQHAVGVVFASVANGHTLITDAVTLAAPEAAHPFEELKGDELAVPAHEPEMVR
jgi:transcriptional regulator with XRE-family HTH domain